MKLSQGSALETEYAINESLKKEKADLTERLLKVENAYKKKSEAEWRLNDLYQKMRTDYANAEKCSREYFTRYRTMVDRCVKAEDMIRKFLNAKSIEDTCVAESEAEQFLKED